MGWTVLIDKTLETEVDGWSGSLKSHFDKAANMLHEQGPQLGRPHADHLKVSKHGNMKELRFSADGGCWRLAFAFNSNREAIILAAGDKSGKNGNKFYKWLVKQADARFKQHLDDCQNKRWQRCASVLKK